MLNANTNQALQALIGYHQGQLLICNARVISGAYKTDKVHIGTAEGPLMDEDALLEREIVRMRTHTKTLFDIYEGIKRDAVEVVNVLIRDMSDETLNKVFTEDVVTKVKNDIRSSSPLVNMWESVYYAEKLTLLRTEFSKMYGKNAPNVTYQMS